MKNFSRFLLLLLIYPIVLSFKNSDRAAQSIEKDSTSLSFSLQRGEEFDNLGKFDEAVALLDSVAAVAEKRKDWEIFTEAYNWAAHASIGMAKYDQAKKYTDRALKIGLQHFGKNHVQVAQSYNLTGIYCLVEGDYDQALEYFLLAFRIRKKIYGKKEVWDIGESYNNLAICYGVKGYYEEEFNCARKSLDIALKTQGPDSPEASGAYGKIADCYGDAGDSESALPLFQKSLQIMLKAGVNYAGNMATGYSDIGDCYFDMKKYDEALKNFEESLKISLDMIQKGGKPLIEISYANIAKVYAAKGDHKKALSYYQKGLEYLEKTKRIYTDNAAFVYKMAADSYRGIGDSVNFFRSVSASLSVLKKRFGEKHLHISDVYRKIGTYFFVKKEIDSSLVYFQKSLTAYVRDFNDPDPFANPSSVRIYDPRNALPGILSAKAKALKQKYEQNRQEVRYLEKSYETYLKALEASEHTRQNFIAYESQIRILGRSSELCAAAADVAYELYRLKGDKKYIREMFFLSEKSKSALLKEALTDKKARYFSGVPKELSEKERKLKIDMNYYEKRLSGAGDRRDPKIDAIRDKLIKAKREYEQLVMTYKERYPEYYALKFKEAPKSIDLIRKNLPNKGVVVEYFLTAGAVNIFVIGPKVFHLARVEIDSSLYRSVTEFRTLLTAASDDAPSRYAVHGGVLYQKLIKPVERFLDTTAVRHITVIPDGYLAYIPLDALPDREPKGTVALRDVPYLLRKYAVSYAYTAFPYEGAPEQKKLSEDVLAFCPFGTKQPDLMAAENRTKYAALPFSKKEISGIAEVYESTNLFQAEASERRFKQAASDHRIVHLATHAFLNEKNPLYSGLLLAKDSTEDGTLHLYELYQTKLNSDLAVLSACNTGFGTVQYGEGLMSLGRAFAYAGCPSIVVSLWQANDFSSAEIMKFFYEELKQGKTKDEALRNAKIRYLESTDHVKAHPLFWAGYIQIGDIGPVGEKGFGVWYILLIGAGAAVVIFFFTRQRRTRKI